VLDARLAPSRLGTFVCLSLLVGCSIQQGPTVGDPPSPAEVQPQFVAVLSEGVTIHAEDGSWTIAEGDDPLPPPFRTDSLRLTLATSAESQEARIQAVLREQEASAANMGPKWQQFMREQRQRQEQQLRQMTPQQREEWLQQSQLWEEGGAVLRVPGKHASLDELLDLHQDFLAAGAQRVRVQAPGREKALYGVLALTPAVKDTKDGSARRAYRIMVPQARVQQALGAQIALVCQPYRAPIPVVKGRMVPTTDAFALNDVMVSEYHDTEELECVTWILWISDSPFAGHDPNWEPPK
jgi:hypothetical protein